MNLWEWLSSLPIWYQLSIPAAVIVGTFIVVYKILSRRIRITRAGITVDKIDAKPK